MPCLSSQLPQSRPALGALPGGPGHGNVLCCCVLLRAPWPLAWLFAVCRASHDAAANKRCALDVLITHISCQSAPVLHHPTNTPPRTPTPTSRDPVHRSCWFPRTASSIADEHHEKGRTGHNMMIGCVLCGTFPSRICAPTCHRRGAQCTTSTPTPLPASFPLPFDKSAT